MALSLNQQTREPDPKVDSSSSSESDDDFGKNPRFTKLTFHNYTDWKAEILNYIYMTKIDRLFDEEWMKKASESTFAKYNRIELLFKSVGRDLRGDFIYALSTWILAINLSLAVDCILVLQQVGKSKVLNFKSDLVSQQEGSDHLSSPCCSTSTPFDAESQVREELLRALPDELSLKTLHSSSPRLVNHQRTNGTRHETHYDFRAFLKDKAHSPPGQQLGDVILLVLTSSDEYLFADLELLPENDFENESSVFDSRLSGFHDFPPAAPISYWNRPLPSLGLTVHYVHPIFIRPSRLLSPK